MLVIDVAADAGNATELKSIARDALRLCEGQLYGIVYKK